MINSPNYRNRRRRLFDEQHGECWYCGVTCWLPAQYQNLAPKRRAAPGTMPVETMATIEHQHNRDGTVARQVMACQDCNSRKGTISGALNGVWLSRIWEEGGDAGEGDVVQPASGEAAGPDDVDLHLP